MRSATLQDGDPVTSVLVRQFFVTSLQVSCSDVTACSFTVRRVANSLLYWATYKIATIKMSFFKSSENIQKTEDTPDRSVLDTQSSFKNQVLS